MSRILARLAPLILFVGHAAAQPMWEQADRWTCTMKMHMIADLASGTVAPSGKVNSFEIDFAKGTRTSGFVDTVGVISDQRFVESVYGGFNMFTVAWAGEPYPNIIVEKGGEFWETTASGHASRDVWISNYQCVPTTSG